MRALLVAGLLAAAVALATGSGVVVGPQAPAAADVAAGQVEFVDAAADARNSTSPRVVVPLAVQAGDRLVLLLSLNATSRSVSPPSGGPAWSLEGDRAAGSMRTLVWSAVAGAGDAGAQVVVGLSARTKTTLQVAAYRGVAADPLTVVSAGHTTTSTVRTTPVATAPDGAWAVSFWSSKSAATTSWSPPFGVTARSSAVNTGSGRIASLLADSGGPVPAGSYGGLAATSDAPSAQATTWTVVLPAAGPPVNQPPVATFTRTCTSLDCTFDASTSADGGGPIASYDWDFGDATTGSGVVAAHTYVAPGTYDVVLTVTDGEGLTGTTTQSVRVPPRTVVPEVAASAETAPVPETGDAADDPAIWVHPTDPAASLVIGNDKQGALEVYDLAGNRLQRITTGTAFWGNVDVRQGVTIGSRTLDLVAAYNAGIRMYDVDPVARQLVPVGDGTGSVYTAGGEGLCAYHSAQTGDVHVFVITRAGRVRQYLIHDGDGDGLLQGALVREFFVGSESEGCAADDASGMLYVAEEDVGLWRYGAEPGDGSTRTLVDSVQPGGHLAYDVEGVTLAQTGATGGYLLVSAQNGANPSQSYVTVYDRETNEFLGSFRIVAGTLADGCERTDGIAAQTGDLGPAFPAGLFVCQDDGNGSPAPGNQNFKLTRLDQILPDG